MLQIERASDKKRTINKEQLKDPYLKYYRVELSCSQAFIEEYILLHKCGNSILQIH